MYGWLEQGVTFNSLSPRTAGTARWTYNDRSNNYELNQFWLGFERKVKTDGCGFDIGGRIDLMYGTDWRYGDCLGLEQNYRRARTSFMAWCFPSSTRKSAMTT